MPPSSFPCSSSLNQTNVSRLVYKILKKKMRLHTAAALLVFGASSQKAFSVDCGFCPDGYEPQKTSAMYNATRTCGDIHDHLVEISDTDECLTAQIELVLSNYPTQCGYCQIPVKTSRCSLCADGSIPASNAATITWKGSSCGQLAMATLFDAVDSEGCGEFQAKVGPECGCAPAGPVCSVCASGPVPHPKAFSKAFNMTCGEIEAYAKQIPEDTNDCKYFRDQGMVECGCVFTAEPNVLPDNSTNPPTIFTDDPTFVPTFEPSLEPTLPVTSEPTTKGTENGTGSPTLIMGVEATASEAPTKKPTVLPDDKSSAPTASPTDDVQARINLQFSQESSEASAKVVTVFWLGITVFSVAFAWC